MKSEQFEELKESLGEALTHAKGKVTLETTRIALPEKPAPMSSAQIRKVRKGLGFSQAVFARVLNVSRDTEISWEQGIREPSGPALKLLTIAKENPNALLGA